MATRPMHLDGDSIARAIDAAIVEAGNTSAPATTSTRGVVKEAAHVAPLTDSTGGAPAATLVVVRSDTAAHTAADAIANFASLNAQLNAVVASLHTAGIIA